MEDEEIVFLRASFMNEIPCRMFLQHAIQAPKINFKTREGIVIIPTATCDNTAKQTGNLDDGERRVLCSGRFQEKPSMCLLVETRNDYSAALA